MRVLLIEDEPDMARALGARLGRSGFIADYVGALEEARAALQCHRYGLALLDRRLPDGDGLELLPELKRLQPGIRILVLTACETVSERICGLDAGADDYLAKPFDLDELMARIRACLRRPGGEAAPPVLLGALSFDLASQQVSINGKPLVLHRRELALLEMLMRNAGRLVLRNQLQDEVYGFDDDVQDNALNILVSRLRKRLQDLGAGVEIHAARGIGYMIARAPER
ncbi:response regulator transcription factor [Methylocystis sp. MJC1]|jgi:two-component system OmpR family response regulator|uniref:response regulator transcription factor n=1 Tax=Methylocystis sp. MJC1 TaxID=2654282 RepID=UPI0013EA1C5C|nr:response regulator transcription factor [Methylocystis sp. MJC1]KAF2990521.1 Transcriptional regulatory protein BasR [Methylocystis sp. MJC1]MBU6525816.1 response regulator transcription factor [Methylocystis sp. MJC1]UZX12283.1 response regulator transcription factor [Methylocystis sp. MJC1]